MRRANEWDAAHRIARGIPTLPEPEKRAAVSLLLARLIELLRGKAT